MNGEAVCRYLKEELTCTWADIERHTCARTHIYIYIHNFVKFWQASPHCLLFYVKLKKQRRLEPLQGNWPVQITSLRTAEGAQSSPLHHCTILYVPTDAGKPINAYTAGWGFNIIIYRWKLSGILQNYFFHIFIISSYSLISWRWFQQFCPQYIQNGSDCTD